MVVVVATKTVTTTHHRPTLNRHRTRNEPRTRRPVPQPGGLGFSAAPPQVLLPGTPWGAATTAGPAQGKPAHQTGLETATAERRLALHARRLGEVEGRRLLHRLAAGPGMNLRALAGVAGGR